MGTCSKHLLLYAVLLVVATGWNVFSLIRKAPRPGVLMCTDRITLPPFLHFIGQVNNTQLRQASIFLRLKQSNRFYNVGGAAWQQITIEQSAVDLRAL